MIIVGIYREHFPGDAVPGGKHELNIRTISLPNRNQVPPGLSLLARLRISMMICLSGKESAWGKK